MKSLIAPFVALAISLPGFALAADPDAGMTDRGKIMATESIKNDKGEIVGYVDIITHTTTITRYENAYSDTDYRANRPNPGRKTVEVIVEQEQKFRDINDVE